MAKDPRKQQKKKERHASKRKARERQLARGKNVGLAQRMAVAADAPVLHSWISDQVFTRGIGSVLLSRLLPSGQVAVAVFLVDVYCLGVKDALAEILSRYAYENRFEREMRARSQGGDFTPAAVRKLVEGGVEYARRLGLQPHPDYQVARLIFGTIDPSATGETFEYGKDGKPYFIAGPHDSPERCRRILRTLERSCGPEGYHTMMPMAGDSEVLPFDLEDMEEFEDQDLLDYDDLDEEEESEPGR
jgi:hypothetical protein